MKKVKEIVKEVYFYRGECPDGSIGGGMYCDTCPPGPCPSHSAICSACEWLNASDATVCSGCGAKRKKERR